MVLSTPKKRKRKDLKDFGYIMAQFLGAGRGCMLLVMDLLFTKAGLLWMLHTISLKIMSNEIGVFTFL